jgi:glucose/arabinose dehydrogenase
MMLFSMLRPIILLIFLVVLLTPTQAQENSCPPIEGLVPRSSARSWCYREAWENPDAGELGYTSLAWWQGQLWATRPLTGELLALRDNDGDAYFDEERIVADGLAFPNALAVGDDGLYIAGDAYIYRLTPDETLITLVDDLPAGRGAWTGGIAVDATHVYVGTGAPCWDCAYDALGDVPEYQGRGAIWQYHIADDGRLQEGRIVAHGLRYPSGLWLHEGALWITDSARPNIPQTALNYLDELNRLNLADIGETDEPMHLGYPYCIGAPPTPDAELNPSSSRLDCTTTQAPTYSFRTHSYPQALAYFPPDVDVPVANSLVVVQSGSLRFSYPYGYALFGLHLTEDGQPVMPPDNVATIIIPYDEILTSGTFSITVRDGNLALQNNDARYSNSIQAGLFPLRPYGVAVDEATGTIYYSWGYEMLISMTPANSSEE